MTATSSFQGTSHSSPDSTKSVEPDLKAIATHNAIKEADGKALWDRVVIVLGVFTLTCFFIEPVNRMWRGIFSIPAAIQKTKEDVDKVVNSIAPDFTKTPLVGQEVSGYKVTSQFGPRQNPFGGEMIEGHGGVDLTTPTGTILFAPASSNTKVTVKCKFQAGLAGLYAEVTSPEYPEYTFQLMHLHTCITGVGKETQVQGGTAFARTGGEPQDKNAGRSTGPHLHITQIKNGKRVEPMTFFAMYFLEGKPPAGSLMERNKENKPQQQTNEK